MFTGIVENTGKIKEIKKSSQLWHLYIETTKEFNADIKIGDSIAIDGLCLTVEEVKNNILKFSALKSSIEKSILNSYRINTIVNMEKSLTLKSYLGGHLVSGHIDTIGYIKKIINKKNTLNIEIELFSKYGKYLLENDSIAINGISLTIKTVYNNLFTINIIPETLKKTNLKNMHNNNTVNVEINHITKSIYEFVKRGIK